MQDTSLERDSNASLIDQIVNRDRILMMVRARITGRRALSQREDRSDDISEDTTLFDAEDHDAFLSVIAEFRCTLKPDASLTSFDETRPKSIRWLLLQYEL